MTRFTHQSEQNKKIILKLSDDKAREEIENLAARATGRLKDLQKEYIKTKAESTKDKIRAIYKDAIYKDIFLYRELSIIYDDYHEYQSHYNDPQQVLLEIKMHIDLRLSTTVDMEDAKYYSVLRG